MMKNKILILIMCAIFCIVPSLAFADEGDLVTEYNEDPETQQMINDAQQTLQDQQTLFDSKTTLLSVNPNNTTGFHRVIIQLLGNYETIVTDHTYQNYNGYTQHSIDVQPDYSWIASAVIFAIVLYCALRFIGGIFSGRQ